jgi:chitinase
MVPNRNPLYTYDNLVTAAQKYQQFCNEGTDEQRKREAAAFLANIAHETTEAGTLRLEGVTPGVSTSLRR